MVELTVGHTPAGAHALNIPRPDDATHRRSGRSVQPHRTRLAVAHAVLVRQFSGQHIADDFHVAVAMRSEARARRNSVFIDDAQVTESHMLGIAIVGK